MKRWDVTVCRPLSSEEISTGAHQVITCNERAREVVVSQNVGGKALGRTFHFDKVMSRLYKGLLHMAVG